MKRAEFENYLGELHGLGPSIEHKNASFNNVVWGTDLLLALKTLGESSEFEKDYIKHLKLTDTLEGGYAPKNSHDNIVAKIAGLDALGATKDLEKMDVSALTERKHPRDIILFNFFLGRGLRKFLASLFLPLAMLDMIRAAILSFKIRPTWYHSWFGFELRVKASLGLLKELRTEDVFAGRQTIYEFKDEEHRILTVQNDGVALNLMRLHIMKKYTLLKPFVSFMRKIYEKRFGKAFEDRIFMLRYQDYSHPVRIAYRRLNRANKSLLDI